MTKETSPDVAAIGGRDLNITNAEIYQIVNDRDKIDEFCDNYRSLCGTAVSQAPHVIEDGDDDDYGWICYNDGPGDWFWCATENECQHELTDEETVRRATAVEKMIFHRFGAYQHSGYKTGYALDPMQKAFDVKKVVDAMGGSNAEQIVGKAATLWGYVLELMTDPDASVLFSNKTHVTVNGKWLNELTKFDRAQSLDRNLQIAVDHFRMPR